MTESQIAAVFNCAAELALTVAVVLGIGAGLWAIARRGRHRFHAERR